jgi:hypothetical protein
MPAQSATAIVIVRIWFEGDPPTEFRGRIVEVVKGASSDRVIASVATPQDLYACVRSWVERLTPD